MMLTGMSCRDEIFKIKNVHISRFAVPSGTAAGFFVFRRSSSSSSNRSIAASPGGVAAAPSPNTLQIIFIPAARIAGCSSGTLGNKNRSTGPILFTSPSITPAFFAISISPAQNPVTPTSETASTTASREARITPSVTSGIRPCIAPYTMPRSSMELHRTFIASPD